MTLLHPLETPLGNPRSILVLTGLYPMFSPSSPTYSPTPTSYQPSHGPPTTMPHSLNPLRPHPHPLPSPTPTPTQPTPTPPSAPLPCSVCELTEGPHTLEDGGVIRRGGGAQIGEGLFAPGGPVQMGWPAQCERAASSA